jgi:hypothetical protein
MHARHSEADMQVGHQNIQDGDQFESNYRRGHSGWKVCLGGVQLARDESLVPKRSPLRENSSGISKGIFQMDISGFESYMPSQAVRSLRGLSALPEYERHSRGLARRRAVSTEHLLGFLAPPSQFRRRVSGRHFQFSALCR